MKVFQMLTRQYSVFHEGKTTQSFSYEKYEQKLYLMLENL